MTILLLRHARAGSRHNWPEDDRLRPLTRRGRAQAEGLVALLDPWTSEWPEPVLVSSPWARCIETVTPLAAALGVPIAEDDRLGEGMGVKAAGALPGWFGPVPSVLCTHGDVIEQILVDLAAAGVDVGINPSAAKGSVWVLEDHGGAVHHARYLSPAE